MSTLVYTNIQHDFRKAHALSCNEYILLDMIYFLHTRPSAHGWCSMKREEMAAEIGMSKQGLIDMIDRLITKEFLLKNPATKALSTTEKWHAVYFNPGKETLPTPVKKLYPSGKETLPTLLICINNKENKGAIVSKSKWGDDEIITEAWSQYTEFRKSEHKGTFKSEATEIIALNRLFKETEGNHFWAADAIDKTIASGWKGIFPDQSKPVAEQHPTQKKMVW